MIKIVFILGNVTVIDYICREISGNNGRISSKKVVTMRTDSCLDAYRPFAVNHISVDCVILGFDGKKLHVLLINRTAEIGGETIHDLKLPGDLIYEDENLDDAAARVLRDLTGIKNINLLQFKAYGSKDRTKNRKDVLWLEHTTRVRVERIVTVAYLSLVRIGRQLAVQHLDDEVCWVAVDELSALPFDHNAIIQDALEVVRSHADADPSYLFNLLPHKFTALQLRTLCERVYGKRLDVRNFQKKINQLDYVVAIDERERGVAHRAARLYRFDRKIFRRSRR